MGKGDHHHQQQQQQQAFILCRMLDELCAPEHLINSLQGGKKKMIVLSNGSD